MASKILLDDPKKFEEFLTRLFKKKDKNNDGKLDYNEIKELLNIYFDKASEQDLKIEFNKIDVNHDGELSLEEFKTMFKNVMDRLNKRNNRK